MGEATVACCYFIFALLFASFNVLMQDVTVRSQMRFSVVERYIQMPFQFQPEYPYDGISVPSELYEWLRQAFVPVTYAEHPQMGSGLGFCSKSYPCQVSQGECRVNNQCEDGLVCRDHRTINEGVITNGNYWDKQELENWCNFLGTPVDFSLDGSADSPEYQNCTASPTVLSTVGPCCWDKKANAYITLIVNATSSTLLQKTFTILGRGNCPVSISPHMDCCTKNTSVPLSVQEVTSIQQEAESANPRPVNVGNFNRILMMRFSMKRYKKVRSSANAAFTSLTPYALSGGGSAFSPDKDNGDAEDKAALNSVAKWHAQQYNYQKKDSFNDAGGYVTFFAPSQGRNNLRILLQRLWLDGFFDQRLATLVIDMMFYNGQSDNFMHVALKFVFHPGGACDKLHEVRFCGMMGNSWTGVYLIGHLIEFALIAFVIFFVICEIRKASENGFGGLSTIVDCSSLLLCTFSLLMNFIIRLEPVYRNFEFSSSSEYPISQKDFTGIIALMKLINVQSHIIAINLLMIFFRAVVMITSLDATVGLIINTLSQCLVNILYFSLMFFFLMIGSVAFAFFTFGNNPRETGMSSPIMTFYETFAMLMGRQDFDGLHKADPVMAYLFFFSFYILVLFVMLNMFISILLSGYDICIEKLHKRDAAEGLFAKIKNEVKQDILNKCFSRLKYVWRDWIHPCLVGFYVGMTSCIQDTIAPLVSGLSLPTAQRCFDSCCWCFKSNADPNEEYRQQMKWASDLLKIGKKKYKRIHEDSPNEADTLQHAIKAVEDLKADEKKKKEKEGEGYVASKDTLESLRKALDALDELVMNTVETVSLRESCLMVTFMGVFSSMLVIMARGEDTFYLSRSNMDFGTQASWITTHPLRIFEYNEIDSMEHVGEWAVVLIDALYEHLACRVEGVAVPSDILKCDPSDDHYAVVQEVNNWNIGFLNTTFLRLSIQPGCYVDNPNSRWFYGAKHLRSHAMSGDCLFQSCFSKALDQEGTCRTHAGVPFDPSQIEAVNDALSPEYYNYSHAGKLGPFQLHGGITVSFGRSKTDALAMLHKLVKDGWFTKRSASLMFDYITYNGNLDMFSHSMFGFSLLASGYVEVEHISQNFALHIQDAGGSFHSWRIAVIVLFVIYVIMVVFFLGQTLYDMNKMRAKGKRLKHKAWSFIFNYYKSLWNRTDSLSLFITLVSLVIYILFMLDSFRNKYKFSIGDTDKYQVPLSESDHFGMPAEVDATRYQAEDWYVFHRFEKLGDTYDVYMNLAAVNAFFIAVKIVKYANAVQRFKHYASTLAQGSEQMAYFSIVILLLLVGWALFFYFLFGVHVQGLQDPLSSVYRCFSWVLGEFADDMEGMLRTSLLEALIAFVLFQVMMYFICLNMFLATMLNTYCDTVGRTEVEHEKRRLKQEQSHSIIDVEYQDKASLKNDLKIKKDELGEVWVDSVNEDTNIAGRKGVEGGGPGKGSQILRVNGERTEWRDFNTEIEIFEEGINPDQTRDDKIHIQFKAPKKKKPRWIDNLFFKQDDDEAWQEIKPTVKTFWRAHGAVTWLHNRSQKNGIEADDPPDMEETEGSERKEDIGAQLGSSNEERKRRYRMKRRLDQLLFSRAKSSRKAKDDDALTDVDGNVASADGKFEDDLGIDALRGRIEMEDVVGDEVWLDCLMTAIEHEMDDDTNVVTEVLRTNDMNESMNLKGGQGGGAKLDSVNNFYRLSFEVLSILECKAKQKWYDCLRDESVERLELLDKQNGILHDYICELEQEFVNVMQKIHSFGQTKKTMVGQLANLLDGTAYGDRSTRSNLPKGPHMKRLTDPWPAAVASTDGAHGRQGPDD